MSNKKRIASNIPSSGKGKKKRTDDPQSGGDEFEDDSLSDGDTTMTGIDGDQGANIVVGDAEVKEWGRVFPVDIYQHVVGLEDDEATFGTDDNNTVVVPRHQLLGQVVNGAYIEYDRYIENSGHFSITHHRENRKVKVGGNSHELSLGTAQASQKGNDVNGCMNRIQFSDASEMHLDPSKIIFGASNEERKEIFAFVDLLPRKTMRAMRMKEYCTRYTYAVITSCSPRSVSTEREVVLFKLSTAISQVPGSDIKQVKILRQSGGNVCPLLALANICILRGKLVLTGHQCSSHALVNELCKLALHEFNRETLDVSQLHVAFAELPRLLDGMVLDLTFTQGVEGFVKDKTSPRIVFDVFSKILYGEDDKIKLVHGWTSQDDGNSDTVYEYLSNRGRHRT
jgi:hypothetical protein